MTSEADSQRMEIASSTPGSFSALTAMVPSFSGEPTQRISDFFDTIDEIATLASWSDRQKLGIAKCKLSGIAREYAWRDFKIKDITDYAAFKAQMTKRFVRAPYTLRLQQFHTCVQQRGEDVQTFAVRLQSLAADTLIKVASTSEQEKTIIESCQKQETDERLRVQFLNGINDRIKRAVMSHDPKTFDEALLVATREELIDQVVAKPRPYVGRITGSDEAGAEEAGLGIAGPSVDKTGELEAAIKQISDRLNKLEPKPNTAAHTHQRTITTVQDLSQPRMRGTPHYQSYRPPQSYEQILIELKAAIERLYDRVTKLEEIIVNHSNSSRMRPRYQNNSYYNSPPPQRHNIAGIRRTEHHQPPQDKNTFKNRSNNHWVRNHWDESPVNNLQSQGCSVPIGQRSMRYRKPPPSPRYIAETQTPMIQQGSQHKPRRRNRHRKTNFYSQANEPINKQPKNICRITSVKERPQQNTKLTYKGKAQNPTRIDEPTQKSTVARIKIKKNERKRKRKGKCNNQQSRCQVNNICSRMKTINQDQNNVKAPKINSITKIKETKLHKFSIGDRVYVTEVYVPRGLKRKFYPKYSGPYRIIEETSPVNFVVENIQTKKQLRVHANRLKPAIARMEFEQIESMGRDPSRPEPSPEDTPESDADLWDELVFASMRPEPQHDEEPIESDPGLSSRPQPVREYALRSQGTVPNTEWILPTPTRSRIPRIPRETNV